MRSILDAAARIHPANDPEVLILLEEHHYQVHVDGRIDRTVRRVYRIDADEAVDDWSSLERLYQPWYQQTPVLRARVIATNGGVRQLDPKTLTDAPSRQLDSTLFSDDRLVRAPLPGIERGAIVETEVVIRDKSPLLEAGVTQRIGVPDYLALERFHLMVDADPGVPLHTAWKLIPDTAVKQNRDQKGQHIDCELTSIAARREIEFDAPSDTAQRPWFGFSTGKSWQAIAAHYESIADQRLQGSDLRILLEGIDTAADPRELAAQLTARVHKNVRYTGVEFGEAAIVPTPPAETLKRGYGDCKDKAALLVALLRAAGQKAFLALLQSGFGADAEPALPGMGAFDHVIVYVPTNPPLWIDATASDTRVGFLPAEDRGRMALVAMAATSGLVRTPEASSGENWEHQTVEVKMADTGFGVVRVRTELTGGSMEPQARASFGGGAGKPEAKVREDVEGFAKRSQVAKALGEWKVSAREDLTGPFRLSFEALESRTSSTGLDDAAVALSPRTLFDYLPYDLTREMGADEKKKPRRSEFVFHQPYQIEVRYRIIPPAGFRAAKLPVSGSRNFGTTTLSRQYELQPNGNVEVVYHFDSGKGRISAADFDEFRAAFLKDGPKDPELIRFSPDTAELLALGETTRAISVLREQIRRDPMRSSAHVRLSSILLNGGAGDAALEEARSAVDTDPRSAIAWNQLGWVLQFDSFGRLRQGNWDQVETEKAFRKAMEIDPANDNARANLAILLEYNEQGWRYAAGSRMDEAIRLYREMSARVEHMAMVDQNLAIALLTTGDVAGAKQAAAKAQQPAASLLLDTIQAIEESPAQTVMSAQANFADTRDRAAHLIGVAQTLVQLRRYETAAVIMKAVARVTDSAQMGPRAEMLVRVKPWQDSAPAEDDPRAPVWRVLVALLQPKFGRASLNALASKWGKDAFTQAQMEELQDGMSSLRRSLGSFGLEEEAMLDFVTSLTELQKTGDDEHGYRISLVPRGTPAPSARVSAGVFRVQWAPDFSLYSVLEDGRYKLILNRASVGSLVMDRLEKQDAKGAQWWLDRLVEDEDIPSPGPGKLPLSGLWSGTTEGTRGPEAIRTAAAALTGAGTGSAEALAILETARAKGDKSPQVIMAICETLLKGERWDRLMVASRLLLAMKLFHREGLQYFIRAAEKLGKWKELEAEALKLADDKALQSLVEETLVLVRFKQSDEAGAEAWLRKLSAEPSHNVFISWVMMARGKATQETMSNLQGSKDTEISSGYSAASAMLAATTGDIDGAAVELGRLISGKDYAAMPAVAWAVHAKLCREWGSPACEKASLEKARGLAAKEKRQDSTAWLQTVLDGQLRLSAAAR